MCSARCDGSIYYRLVHFCNLRHVPAPCLLNGVVLACIFPPVSQPFESGLLFFFFVFSFFMTFPLHLRCNQSVVSYSRSFPALSNEAPSPPHFFLSTFLLFLYIR